jgi:peroxiredoxin
MQHLPGFVSNSDEILSKGVDQIVCLSVNDSFVMDAWGKDKGTGDKILMLGDGNGDFTEATGLTMDGSGFGLGSRSLRYSMIVDDNSVTKLNLESNPGEIAESSAENILEQL